MNTVLQEFRELRISYSGRIDDALQSGDDNEVNQARQEYKKVLEKYMNYACAYISSHTNKKFSILKKKYNKYVLRSSKSVLRDTESIRNSLKTAALPESVNSNIRIALDVVEEYYYKIVLGDSYIDKDDTNFTFQLVYGLVLVPLVTIIFSVIGNMIISNAAPQLADIDGVKYVMDIVLKNQSMSLIFLILCIVLIVPIFVLLLLYKKKMKTSSLDGQKFMLIPSAILSVYVIANPFILILDKFFHSANVVAINNMNLLLLNTILFVGVFLGFADAKSKLGDYKASLNIIDNLMIIFMIVTVVVPFVYNIIIEFVDFNKIGLYKTILNIVSFKYFKLTILLINLLYVIIMANMAIMFSKRYLIGYKILCVVLSVGALVGMPFIIIKSSNNEQAYRSHSKISRKSLELAFRDIIALPDSSYKSYTVTMGEDTIRFKSTKEKVEWEFHYYIYDQVVFNYEADIYRGMKYKDFKQVETNMSNIMLPYVAVAKVRGADIENAIMHYNLSNLNSVTSLMKNNSYTIVDDNAVDKKSEPVNKGSKIIKTSEFSDYAVEYAKAVYGERLVINDSKNYNSYEMIQELVDVTDDYAKIRVTLYINPNASFNKISS